MSTSVIGYGISGRAACDALRRLGEDCTVFDDREDVRIEARLHGFTVAENMEMLNDASRIIISPGISPDHPAVRISAESGIVLETEIGWARRHLKGTMVAVTGTNGKSTTVHLLTTLLKESGLFAVSAGNIGTPLSTYVGRAQTPTHFVLEVSSFQIHYLLDFSVEAAILLNISPDHLSWHGSLENYSDTKKRLMTFVQGGGVAVVNESIEDVPGMRYGYGDHCDMVIHPDKLIFRGKPIVSREDLLLLGDHNWENTAAAMLAALHLSLSPSQLGESLRKVEPLPHRLETVGEKGGVRFINDSKATNVDAVSKALTSFSGRNVWLILGGVGKGSSYEILRPYGEKVVKGVLCVGEEAQKIHDSLNGSVSYISIPKTLENSFEELQGLVVPGDIVLLSPACSSFDHYASFEKRGEHFKQLVRQWQEN